MEAYTARILAAADAARERNRQLAESEAKQRAEKYRNYQQKPEQQLDSSRSKFHLTCCAYRLAALKGINKELSSTNRQVQCLLSALCIHDSEIDSNEFTSCAMLFSSSEQSPTDERTLSNVEQLRNKCSAEQLHQLAGKYIIKLASDMYNKTVIDANTDNKIGQHATTDSSQRRLVAINCQQLHLCLDCKQLQSQLHQLRQKNAQLVDQYKQQLLMAGLSTTDAQRLINHQLSQRSAKGWAAGVTNYTNDLQQKLQNGPIADEEVLRVERRLLAACSKSIRANQEAIAAALKRNSLANKRLAEQKAEMQKFVQNHFSSNCQPMLVLKQCVQESLRKLPNGLPPVSNDSQADGQLLHNPSQLLIDLVSRENHQRRLAAQSAACGSVQSKIHSIANSLQQLQQQLQLRQQNDEKQLQLVNDDIEQNIQSLADQLLALQTAIDSYRQEPAFHLIQSCI